MKLIDKLNRLSPRIAKSSSALHESVPAPLHEHDRDPSAVAAQEAQHEGETDHATDKRVATRTSIPTGARTSTTTTDSDTDTESDTESSAFTNASTAADSSAESACKTRSSIIHNLKARLAAMHVSRPAGAAPARPSPPRPSTARALDWVMSEFGAGTEAGARVAPRKPEPPPGEVVETATGALYQTRVTFEAEHRHGCADVLLGRGVDAREVALLALDATLESVDFSRALYIDTETTGLAGGAGTLPFLIGMAWFEGERLVVEQLLLPRPGLEAPMLHRLAERLALASAIVSYNGKSFDWPLLRTRFILNRIATPVLPAHLDLLHCARRVYKSRLGSVRLVFLEQALMGLERTDDIPGELIPERYLAFLRGAAPGSSLTPILEHNRSDLVALPALLGDIVRRFDCDEESARLQNAELISGLSPRRQHAQDQLSFARVAARGAAAERAIVLAQRAVAADVRNELTAHALFLVGELKLRAGDLTGAVEAFEGSAEASCTALDCARAHLALAKLHEHKTKQADRALQHASLTAAIEGDEACARRVARVANRLEKRERNSVTT